MLAAICLTLLAGCSLLPQEEEQEKLPDIRIPKISQKPEYPVKRSTLELKVSGSGKLMSEREENLLFTEDNFRVVDVFVKAGDQVKKGQVLAVLDTGDTENQIRRKKIELEKAELDLRETELGLREAWHESSEVNTVQLKKQQLDYGLLKDELADLQGKLKGSKLIAPFDGTIVTFTAEKGDISKSYEKVGQIADVSSLVVAVQFAASDLSSIAAGMETMVSINTAGDHTGKVGRLPVGTEPDTLDSYTLVELPKLPGGVARGTPLSASVIVERKENVLTIPVAALRKQNSRTYVLVSNPDRSKGEVDVEVGIQTSTDVEIIKGLEEGQKVVGK